MIIDATNTILGRLATFAAKQALLGEQVIIINAEKAAVSGRRSVIVEHYKQKFARGVPSKGPIIHRAADRIVKRTIRGMLPYKTSRGREALQRVMCYNGVPEQYATEKKVVKLEGTIQKLPEQRYISIGEIARHLGGKA